MASNVPPPNTISDDLIKSSWGYKNIQTVEVLIKGWLPLLYIPEHSPAALFPIESLAYTISLDRCHIAHSSY